MNLNREGAKDAKVSFGFPDRDPREIRVAPHSHEFHGTGGRSGKITNALPGIIDC